MYPKETSSPSGDLASLPTERLEHEIRAGAADIYARMACWLELVAELDRREAWGTWGCRSCAHWISWQCSITERTARDHVLVARRLGELPQIAEAFRRGELSYSKARALCRIADADSEEDLLELASHATAAQLERVTRIARSVSAAEANQAHEERSFAWWPEAPGVISFAGRMAADEAEVVIAAIEAARERVRAARREEAADQRRPGGSAEPRRVSNADGLVRLAEAYVAAESGEASDPDRGPVVELRVHVDPAALGSSRSGTATASSGVALAPETAQRLACDATLVPISRDRTSGSVADIGRRSRIVPPAMRTALEVRDGGCRFPGCGQRRYVDAHHIVPWARGGHTRLNNLVLLCRRHHRLVHEGGFTVTLAGDGTPHFHRPGGRRLWDSPRLPPTLRGSANDARSAADAGAVPMSGSGEPCDLGLAVDAVLGAGRRSRHGRAGQRRRSMVGAAGSAGPAP